MNTSIYKTLQLINERLLYPSLDIKNGLRKFSLGTDGENKVHNIFKDFDNSWLVIPDYTFKYNGQIAQIDLIIVIGQTWLVIEVKNYETDFYYKNRRGYFDSSKNHMQSDIMASFERRLNLLNKLVLKSGLKAEIEGLMIFANPNTKVVIDPESVSMFNFHILDILALNIWLKQNHKRLDKEWEYLALSTNLEANKNNIKDLWLQEIRYISDVLSHYEYNDFRYFPKPLDEAEYNTMIKGVVCNKCRNIPTIARQRHFYCPKCQFLEPKKDALIRSAHEYRTIFYNDEYAVTSSRMYDFIDGGISRQNIARILSSYFSKNNYGKYTSFSVEPLRGPKVSDSINSYRENYKNFS